MAMLAAVYIKTECKRREAGKFGLFKQEVLAEDKLIRDEFPKPKTREEII